jgi:predicted outer membrane protein
MEANLAEIMMAKLALQKGASAKVKEFAQMMIDEHGSANDQLKAIVSGVAMSGPEQMGTGTATTGGAMGNTGAAGSTTTGTSGASTTASGATTSGTTDGTTTGTSGTSGTSGTTGSSSMGASGTTGTGGNNAPEQMGTGTVGSTGTTSGASTTATGATSPGSVNSGTMGHAGSHATTGTGSADFDDPTMLSPEHRTMMDKLTKLTGAAFDREYMQGQVKDHAKTAALFESQAKNGQDVRLKEYATTLLPSIRKHGQMASDIANSMRSGSSRSGGSSGE